MYSTCLFCGGALGSNEAIERFPIGKRLAFDPKKGRLWVVCGSCRRWNLTPIEERFEAIEDCERLFRATVVRVSTDQIGLATLRSGVDLVRIGEPLRPEFAAWRYAANFAQRRNRSRLGVGGALATAGVASAVVGTGIWSVLSTGNWGVIQFWSLIVPAVTAAPMVGLVAASDYIKNDRIVGRFTRDKQLITVRARHAIAGELQMGSSGDPSLRVPHDGGWAEFQGTEAIQAATVLLANSDQRGANRAEVDEAVDQIQQAGSVAGFLERATQRAGTRRGRMLSTLGSYRGLGAMNLMRPERLALEMAVHEETERRALDGELETLEEAWRSAEEIAAICDGPLTTDPFPNWLRSRLGKREP